MSFGEVGYIDVSGGNPVVTKGNASAPATANVTVMCADSAGIAIGTAGNYLIMGIARDDSWNWTIGGKIYLSTAAGTISQTAPSGSGQVVQILGVANHPDRMLFNPNLVQVEIV
jgi:hypothetical protein